jgi:N-acetylneuraminic acid mutarotase
VYLVGGFGSDRKELAAAYSYDPSSDRWERILDLPTPREHLAVVAYRGSICTLGGHFGQADQTAIVECYDPSSRRWSSLPPLIHPTSDFAAVVSGREIWTVGDYVQVFDGSRWWIGPQLGTPRFGVAAAVLDHTLYVIGGAARTPASAGIVESLNLP